jgi:xylitol oxidase
LGAPGPWYERLPHFRIEFTPSSGEELQSEYLIPREAVPAAIRAVASLRDRMVPLLLVSELRAVARDDLWMSYCYDTDCVAIHFTWRQDWPALSVFLPELERALEPLGARPHWGKLFLMDPAYVVSLYPRMRDFQKLTHEMDSDGKFRNAFLDRYIGG